MKKYNKCTECPRYNRCVMRADLRRKRRRCIHALQPNRKELEVFPRGKQAEFER